MQILGTALATALLFLAAFGFMATMVSGNPAYMALCIPLVFVLT